MHPNRGSLTNNPLKIKLGGVYLLLMVKVVGSGSCAACKRHNGQPSITMPFLAAVQGTTRQHFCSVLKHDTFQAAHGTKFRGRFCS